jgi:hypothetical protein
MFFTVMPPEGGGVVGSKDLVSTLRCSPMIGKAWGTFLKISAVLGSMVVLLWWGCIELE